jgi:AcrR family transcriptional regulator
VIADSHSKSQRDSRESLIAVAGEIFAERGYEATTIKEITDRAGVNVASVNYYFRDKLGLYSEVLRHCVCNGRIALPPEIEALPAEERFRTYVRNFMNYLLMAGKPSWSGRLMIRELAAPTPVLPQIVEEIVRPNLALLRRLITDLAARPLDEETLSLLTHGIHAQCVYWKTSRAIFPYLWPALKFDEAQVGRIADQIATFSIAGIKATG